MAEAGLDLAERESALLGCSVHLPHWRRLLSEIQRIERSSSAPKIAASSNPS